jgi:flagellar motor protein MotB
VGAQQRLHTRNSPISTFALWIKLVPSSSSGKKAVTAAITAGAWKVAYADFVTAMMSLFMVMWLMGSSTPVKEAISGYFHDPSGTSSKKGSALAGGGESFPLTKDNMPELKDQLPVADSVSSIRRPSEVTVIST